MRQPAIALVNLSEAEKISYAEASKKKLAKGMLMYLIPFIVFGTVVALMNVYPDQFGLYDRPDLREWLNVGLVFLTILPARFFVNVILRNRKAQSAWQKKVIRGVIQKIDGKIITVVNQQIKLPVEEISKWKVNDYVIISISTTGDFVFGVEAGKEED